MQKNDKKREVSATGVYALSLISQWTRAAGILWDALGLRRERGMIFIIISDDKELTPLIFCRGLDLSGPEKYDLTPVIEALKATATEGAKYYSDDDIELMEEDMDRRN
jgi:hypothetical protein